MNFKNFSGLVKEEINVIQNYNELIKNYPLFNLLIQKEIFELLYFIDTSKEINI